MVKCGEGLNKIMIKVQTLKAFAAVLVCACGLVGCNREEVPASTADAASPESYMNDPVFMARVDAQDKSQRQIMKKYAELKRAYEAAVAADPAAEATKKLKADLEKLEKEFVAGRQKMAQIVGERLRPQNQQKK